MARYHRAAKGEPEGAATRATVEKASRGVKTAQAARDTWQLEYERLCSDNEEGLSRVTTNHCGGGRCRRCTRKSKGGGARGSTWHSEARSSSARCLPRAGQHKRARLLQATPFHGAQGLWVQPQPTKQMPGKHPVRNLFPPGEPTPPPITRLNRRRSVAGKGVRVTCRRRRGWKASGHRAPPAQSMPPTAPRRWLLTQESPRGGGSSRSRTPWSRGGRQKERVQSRGQIWGRFARSDRYIPSSPA